jgi:hypothetical protein
VLVWLIWRAIPPPLPPPPLLYIISCGSMMSLLLDGYKIKIVLSTKKIGFNLSINEKFPK